MNETRGIMTITEELIDLRRYLRGLPKQLVDTEVFGAYQKRESLLQEARVRSLAEADTAQPKTPLNPLDRDPHP